MILKNLMSYGLGFIKTQEERQFLVDSVKNYRMSVGLSLMQYQEGDTSYQRVVDDQRYLTDGDDRLAAVSGSVAINLINIYKALGGGWEYSVGWEILPEKTRKEMEERTGWGDLLVTGTLPEAKQEPPTGQAVPVLNVSEW